MAAMMGRRAPLVLLAAFWLLASTARADFVIPRDIFIPKALADMTPRQFIQATRLQIEHRPTLITSDAGGTHTTTPGTPYAGVNVDGVGLLSLTTTLGGSSCSASLISDNHLLTAAHCVSTDLSGNNNTISGNVTFETSGGNIVHNFTGGDVSVYPLFDGNVLHGNDVAIITLPGAAVDAAVPRYEIVGPTVYDPITNAGAPEIGVTHVKVGYGQSGFGSTGVDAGSFPVGTKRAGQNVWEDGGLAGHDPNAQVDIENYETQLTYDYDNGTLAGPFFAPTGQDGFGWLEQATGPLSAEYAARYDADTGLGTEEVLSAPGDSGGPTFVDDGGTFKIAGVSSYVLRAFVFTAAISSDIDLDSNFSFGEFGTDARIASPDMNAFIVAAISTAVPEPSSCLFLMLLSVGVGGMRRGQRWRARRMSATNA